MKPIAPHVFGGTIPAADVSSGLEYAIHVDGVKDARVSVAVTSDDEPPTLEHRPVESAPASQPLEIEATVDDPSGVEWVRLRYRSVTQYDDYQTLSLGKLGERRYGGVVPAEALDPKYDLMYFFEVMDTNGNGAIYPDLGRETPYVVVRLVR
jgi:hypothetical protein